PSAKGDDKFITTDYLQQCLINQKFRLNSRHRYMNKLRLMLSVITLNQSRSLRFVRLMRITENVRTLLF
ncbi:hypothetical protein M8D93_004807, partial [Enterobacter hormaechei]